MSTQPKRSFTTELTILLTGKTILAPYSEKEDQPTPPLLTTDRYETLRTSAARNLRRKLVTGTLAGLLTLAIGWSLNALGVIKMACEVVSVVGLLVERASFLSWCRGPIETGTSTRVITSTAP